MSEHATAYRRANIPFFDCSLSVQLDFARYHDINRVVGSRLVSMFGNLSGSGAITIEVIFASTVSAAAALLLAAGLVRPADAQDMLPQPGHPKGIEQQFSPYAGRELGDREIVSQPKGKEWYRELSSGDTNRVFATAMDIVSSLSKKKPPLRADKIVTPGSGRWSPSDKQCSKAVGSPMKTFI